MHSANEAVLLHRQMCGEIHKTGFQKPARGDESLLDLQRGRTRWPGACVTIDDIDTALGREYGLKRGSGFSDARRASVLMYAIGDGARECE